MKKIKNFFKIIRGKKGLTGADVAAAITMIVLTVGIVTAIYVNTINKSKDNVRYSNAVRMATNIIENIQRKPFEYLTAICNTTDSSKTVSTGQIFDTKVPNGFSVTITAKKTADDVDIARDVIVNVKYRANSSYKTITLNTVKQKELMDMTNPPDFSLIPGYKPLDTKNFYYPVKKGDGGKTVVTSTDDINWYDYEDGNYALVCVTSTGTLSVGNEAPSGSKIYVWIPRFVAKVGTGLDNVQFLYGSSKYAITFNQYGNLFAYGLKYSGSITDDSKPIEFNSGSGFTFNAFKDGDGLNGAWYELNGTATDSDIGYKSAKELNKIIKCNNATLPN